MMFVKTFCNPGAYVEVIPAGMQLRLQYNKNGLLEKATIGISDDSVEELPKKAFSQLQKLVPCRISLTGGTTWVYGVLVPADIPLDTGKLPECMYDSIEAKLVDGDKLDFYAGNVVSKCSSFAGSLTVRNWLSMSKFSLLPGRVVPVSISDRAIESAMTVGTTKFEYPYIGGYFIFEGLSCRYVPSNLYQTTVKSVKQELDSEGYLKGKCKTSGTNLNLHYSDVVRFNIQSGSCLLYSLDLNSNALEIMHSRPSTSKRKEPVNRQVQCPVCKKHYLVPNAGPVQCDDPYCMSTQYASTCKLLSVLDLPKISYKEYKELVDADELLCSTDVLCLPNYKDLEVKATLSQVLKACVPVSVCPDESVFEALCNSCNQSVETLFYYAQNPQRIVTELNVNNVHTRRLVEWLSDPYNLSTLQTVLTSVTIIARSSKFEGAPIFRNTSFILTGKFKRGSYEEIISILESYDATILTSMSPKTPDCIITGGLNDGIDGKIVKLGNQLSIPIWTEDAFFTTYEIDKDLQENLL